MVREMFDTVAPRYDTLNRLISLGLDVSWRKKTVTALGLPRGSIVLDLACGTGDLSQLLVRRQMRPIGIDMSLGMLMHDHSEVPLVLGDALSLPLSTGSIDGAVCGFALRNFTSIPPVATELARVVRPGGRIALLDAAKPTNAVARAGYDIWFRHAVPAVGSLLSDSAAYRYLPDSVEYLPAPERMRAIFRDAGFASVGRRTFLAGSAQLITATREGTPGAAA
jgi:demethylmenaquinone methyltransferase/2-methoxy-6-polyprenyl-1,4-benzoquinol methylase